MAKEDTPLDQGVFDSTLEAELAKGTDRRVAEGRARSAAVRAFRAANPEEAAAHAAAGAKAPGRAEAPAAAAAPRPRPPHRRSRCRARRAPSPWPRRRHRARARGAAADRQPAHAQEGRARQAPPAGARAARGDPARRAGAGRPREHVAAPADRGDGGDVHPPRGDDDLLDVHQRAAARAGEREPHAEPVEGALVLPGPAGAPALLPPDGGRHHDPDLHPDRARRDPVRRPQPEQQARRPQDRAHAVHRSCSCSARPSRSSARSSAAPGTTGPGRGHRGCSSNCELRSRSPPDSGRHWSCCSR